VLARVGLWAGLVVVAVGLAVLMFLTGVAYLVVLCVTAPSLSASFGPAGMVAAFALGVPLALALSLAAHEAGHLAAGRTLGLRPGFARVGPLTLTRLGTRWRLGWDRRGRWAGGLVRCETGWGRNWRTAAFLLAGPAANLSLGAAAVVVATLDPLPLVRCWAGLLAANSVLFGLANLVPLREGWLNTDGLALLRLVGGRDAAGSG
jgi:hypothetical protein